MFANIDTTISPTAPLVIIIGFSIYKFRSELVDISYPIFIVTITFLTGLYFRFIKENQIALENLQKTKVSDLEISVNYLKNQIKQYVEDILIDRRYKIQIIEEEKNFQLSLSWGTLDENKKQADICLGCSTIKLSKKVTELIQNINSTN